MCNFVDVKMQNLEAEKDNIIRIILKRLILM